MNDDYVFAWGRTLASIRATTAIESPDLSDVLNAFDKAFSAVAAKKQDRVGAALQQLEAQGLVKQYTVDGIGYEGFWGASRPFVASLHAIDKSLANLPSQLDLGSLAALTQSLQTAKLMDGSKLPPLARKSQSSQNDLRVWRSKLLHERCTLCVRAEEFSRQPTIQPVAPMLKKAKAPGQDKLTGKVEMISKPDGPLISPVAANLKSCAAPAAAPPPVWGTPGLAAEQRTLSTTLAIQLLEVAVSNADVDVHGLAEAVLLCRAHTATLDPMAMQKLMQAEPRLRELLATRLEEAVGALDPKNLWVTFLRMYRLVKQCSSLGYDIPAYTKAREMMQMLMLSDDPVLNVFKLPRMDASVLQHFQALFDLCRAPDFCDLPRLLVERVIEVYHECTRAEYLLRRSQLVSECDNGGAVNQISVKSQQVSWDAFLGSSHKPLEPKYNEFYAFHGTSPAIAEVITDTDFKVKRKNLPADHGYTFGRGVYLSEYATHAQFFAQYVCGGLAHDRCAILVCRVFAGRIQDAGAWAHTSKTHDKAHEFEQGLKNGAYHSTMGAEWPENPELREFILADDDQVLPEFIVICKNEPG